MAAVKNTPVIDTSFCNETYAVLTKPFPEDNIFVHHSRFKLLLCAEIEDLDGSRLSFKGDDIFGPVHDSAVGINGSSDDFIVILEVDDDDLWFIVVAEFLSNADIMIGF